MRKTQGVVRGAVALTVAVGFVKLLGALFKLPLANLLGGEGMGLFSTAYGLFGPLYAATVGGFPTALSALVARYAGQGRLKQIRVTLQSAWLFFGCVGVLGSVLMWALAAPFCDTVGNPEAVWCVRMTSPALFGCCAMSVLRGYYQGLGNMNPTALSQVVEAAVKVGAGLGGALLVRQTGLQVWAQTGLVGTLRAADADTASTLLLPYMAAGATAGVAFSTFAGLLYLLLYRCTVGRRLSVPVTAARETASFREAFHSLVRLSVPICLGSAAVSLTTVVDLFTVMNCLRRAVLAAPEQFAALARAPEHVPNFLYGSYQGMTVSLYLLIPALTASFGISVLPAVSRSLSAGDHAAAREHARTVLRVVWMTAIPVGIGLSALSDPILRLFYPAQTVETAAVSGCLRVLGAAGVFLGMATPIHSLLQASGKPMTPILLLTCGAAVKLCVNLLLIPNPRFGIVGAAWGSLGCNLFLMIGGLFALKRTLRLSLPWKAFGKTLLAGLGCGLAAKLVVDFLPDGAAGTFSGILAGGCVYLTVLWALGTPELQLLRSVVRQKRSFPSVVRAKIR